MGRPIMHFEIASPNLERATDFYRELFDWEVGEELMDGHRLVQTVEGSIGGGLLRAPEGVFSYVTVYVGVEDLQASLQKVEELGGKVIVEPMPIPGFGEFAMFQDPDGRDDGVVRGALSISGLETDPSDRYAGCPVDVP